MSVLNLQSYIPLSTITLPIQCHLHLQACCPTMDLIALITYDSDQDVGSSNARVVLQRLSGGPEVWSVQFEDKVGGLVWRSDGLYLAVFEPSLSQLSILSVHDGSVVRKVNVPRFAEGTGNGKGRDVEGEFWSGAKMEWNVIQLDGAQTEEEGGTKEEVLGSAFDMLFSLPLVTSVAPPKLPSASPFFPMLNARFSQLFTRPSHILHSPLPRLLSSSLPPSPPNPEPLTLLTLSRPFSPTQPFLSGTYPLPPQRRAPLLPPNVGDRFVLPSQVEEFTRCASAIEELVQHVAHGLAVMSRFWKSNDGGGGVAVGFLEDISGNGLKFRETIDIPANLTKLLVTGRANDSVSHWLGGQLTSRILNRWESCTIDSLVFIRNTCYRHVTPSLERIILLLDEILGWSLWPPKYGSLNLDPAQVKRMIELAKHGVFMLCRLEKVASEERKRFTEFIKWLKYEVAAASCQDPTAELTHLPIHDVLVVADYIQTSLLTSPIDVFFNSHPNTLENVQPPIQIPPSLDTLSPRSLQETIASTLTFVDPSSLPVSSSQPRSSNLANSLRAQGKGLADPDLSRASSGTRDHRLRSSILGRRKSLGVNTTGTGAGQHSIASFYDQSSMIDETSMAVDVDLSESVVYPAGSAGENVGEGRDPEKEVGLEDVVQELVGVFKKVLEDALPASEGALEAQAKGAGEEYLEYGGMVREWFVGGQGEGELPASYIAFIAPAPHQSSEPLLWIMSRSASNPLAIRRSSFQLVVQLAEGVRAPCEIVDMGFFNDEELVVVLDVQPTEGPKVFLASVAYTTVEFDTVETRTAVSLKEALQVNFSQHPPSLFNECLPLTRARHIPSLDRLPRPSGEATKIPLASLALNGNPARMTGSVLTWEGRELIVFDMAEDEGEEDGESEEGMEC